MPISAGRTRFSLRPSRITRHVPENGRHGTRPATLGGASGIPRLATTPISAMRIRLAAIAARSRAPSSEASTPASSVPSRIDTKVPRLTQALPLTSSVAARCCGRMAYLTGPNSADCVPIMNSSASSRPKSSNQTATAAAIIVTSSSSLRRRTSRCLSRWSASVPPQAENRKKGRMNSPAARLLSSPVSQP